MQNEMVLLGDEAVALAAIHAGISSAYAYPGTPSTEIMEYLIDYKEKHGGFHPAWCANEKTAYEDALGASFAGKRVLVSMKHVGLNVAADAFVNSALLDINGGLVLAIADDPGMHSSQNEQDSRFYADFAKIICLEPTNQQEAYEMTREAFDLSEKYKIPVMVRLYTRLAHSRASIITSPQRRQNPLAKPQREKSWMLLPAMARRRWSELLALQGDLQQYSEEGPWNKLELKQADTCVITSGLGKNYFLEIKDELKEDISHLHVSAYPLPIRKIQQAAAKSKHLIFLEEGNPFIESKMRGIIEPEIQIDGKLNGKVSLTGELDPDNIRPVLGLESRVKKASSSQLPGRPPQLCKGCPHADAYQMIKEGLEDYPNSVVTSDIGCYSLGALPPYGVPESIVCMGASVGMAKGASEAGLGPAVAVIGDSTFLHSGLPSLLDAAEAKTNMTLVILDNSTVAMTGGQPTILPSSKLESLILGIGVEKEHLHSLIPLAKNHAENLAIFKKELQYEGLSVIITVRECLETLKRKKRK